MSQWGSEERNQLWEMLSEGLDLCVRARRIDDGLKEKNIRDTFPKSAAMYPEEYSRSGTPHLWVQEQYDRDLERWEEKVRAHLTKFPYSKPHTNQFPNINERGRE